MTRSPRWTSRLRSDLILLDETLDTPELLRYFRIGGKVDYSTRHSVLSIMK